MKSLGKLIDGISLSMKSAQEKIEEHTLQSYRKFFTEEEGEDGILTMRPVMVKIPLPDKNGNYVDTDIPIVALMQHNTLNLEEVRLKMNVRTVSTSDKSDDVDVEVVSNLTSESGEKTNSSGTNCEIELLFKSCQNQEGVSRITTKLIQMIQ